MALVMSRQERMAVGQQRRKQMRRVDQATWKVKERKVDPLKLLDASMKGRVPALVEMKYRLMAMSPFAYFRGAVPVMAYDLSLVGNTGIVNQLCGDAHVRNLGAFAGPDGRLVFDINDFDETIAGPFEWDVKRMATSLVLAGRGAGAKNVDCREAAAVFLERSDDDTGLCADAGAGGGEVSGASAEECVDCRWDSADGGTGYADAYAADADGA